MRLLLSAVHIPADMDLTFQRPNNQPLHRATMFADATIRGPVVSAWDGDAGVFLLHTPHEGGPKGRTLVIAGGVVGELGPDTEQAVWCREQLASKGHAISAERAKAAADIAKKKAEEAQKEATEAEREAKRQETIRQQGLCNLPVDGGSCVRPRQHHGNCRAGSTAKKDAA